MTVYHTNYNTNDMDFDDSPWGQFVEIEVNPPQDQTFMVLPYRHTDSDDEEKAGEDEATPIYWSLYVFAGGTLASLVSALTFKFG